jgi:putative DNA primase/helicase
MKTVDRARGRWREILPQLGIATRFLVNRHGPCPLCGGEDRFRFDDRYGSGSYYCGQCGPGSGLLMVQKKHRWDFATAAREVDKIIGSGPPRQIEARPEPDRDQLRQKLVTMLEEANAPRLVAGYLRGRGLRTVPKVLRGHRALPYVDDGAFLGHYGAMLAPVVALDGELRSVHRTYLGDVPRRKKLAKVAATVSGCAVRLFDFEETLGVAEGIETAIAAYELFGIPTWAALNAGGVEKFEVPDGIENFAIFGDNDVNGVGKKAAYALAWRLACDRPELNIAVKIPPTEGTDWLDVLQAKRRAAA